MKTHGMSRTPTHRAWLSMRDRCQNPKNHAYKNYGGRGITVCKRWEKFENFLADMGVKPEGLTLDRKDNDKGYSPDNCRWATYKEQILNRRVTHWITADGIELCRKDCAIEHNINPVTLASRLRRDKMSLARALQQKDHHRKITKEEVEEIRSLKLKRGDAKKWAEYYGVSPRYIRLIANCQRKKET